MAELMVHPEKGSRVKIMRSMANTGFLNVWEGAVRSSKTVVALTSFLFYVMESPETVFIMSGRTASTLEKNCILGDYGVLALVPGSQYRQVHKSQVLLIPTQNGVKTIYTYGASDIQAHMALRGLTAGGWFADEINMHDREFVAEAFKRTVASKDRKHFWTLNPDNPYHWVYEDYIDFYDFKTKEEKKALGGFHLWKFYLQDNPILTPERIEELKHQYAEGSFQYRRAILGERCIAEGLIYPGATEDRVCADLDLADWNIRYASIDFGTNHATVMYLGGFHKLDRRRWAIVGEYYSEKEDLTTEEFWEGFVKLCESHGVDPQTVNIAIDPSAGAIKVEFQKHRAMAFNARNDVLDGIEYTKKVLYDGTLRIARECRQMLRQFSTYSWDEKASARGEDKPVKINDDCMDSLRYFVYTHIRPILGG